MPGVSAAASLSNALGRPLKRRGRQALDQRAAEIERAQLREREAGVVEPPERPLLEQSSSACRRAPRRRAETRRLQRLEIAADGARRDAGLSRPGRRSSAGATIEIAQDRPLPDDFGVARHDGSDPCHRRQPALHHLPPRFEPPRSRAGARGSMFGRSVDIDPLGGHPGGSAIFVHRSGSVNAGPPPPRYALRRASRTRETANPRAPRLLTSPVTPLP